MDNTEKMATQGTEDEEEQNKNKQNLIHSFTNPRFLTLKKKKKNTICVGQHYIQANTNNVNKT